MVTTPQVIIFTRLTNQYSMKPKQNKQKSHHNKCKKSRNSVRISLKSKPLLRYKISNNCWESLVKMKKRTSKCLSLSISKAIKSKNFNNKLVSWKMSFKKITKRLKILIRKSISIKWNKSWKIYKSAWNRLKISTKVNKKKPRYYRLWFKEFSKQLNVIGK